MASVKYCLLIKGDRVQVRKYEPGVDYSAEVEEIFEKFKQGAVNDGDRFLKLILGRETFLTAVK